MLAPRGQAQLYTPCKPAVTGASVLGKTIPKSSGVSYKWFPVHSLKTLRLCPVSTDKTLGLSSSKSPHQLHTPGHLLVLWI